MAAYSIGDILANTAQLQPKQHRKIRSARSRNRAAAWRYDLEQWHQYRRAMAKSDPERQGIDAEYDQRAAAGPDFAGYHAKSDFSEPHVHDLDKGGKQAILAAFDTVRSWLWRNCRKARGQAVSRTYREVLAVVLSFAVKYGQAYPCQATIAKLACCSERTVANALQWLRIWGFLDWQRRLKRIPSRLGSITRQTSNAYRIALQGLAAIGAGVFSRGADRNNCSPSPFTPLTSHIFAPAINGAG
jgi:hypothetical protein